MLRFFAGKADSASDSHAVANGSLPFALMLVLAFALYPWGGNEYGAYFILAAILAAFAALAVAFGRWDRLPAGARIVPSLAALAVIALLRQGHGGEASGYAPLVLVPVVWLALYGRRLHLIAGVAGVAATLMLPILSSSSLYPGGEWRRAIFLTLLSGGLGFMIQSLFQSLHREIRRRERAERKLRELQAAEVNDDIVQSLTVAQFALALDEREQAQAAVEKALSAAKAIIASLVHSGGRLEPGRLVRERPANADRPEAPTRDFPSDR